MYLSTFTCNNKQTLMNRNYLHKDIMSMFEKDRKNENVLFAVSGNRVIVQSDNRPDAQNKNLKLQHSKCCDDIFDSIPENGKIVLFGVLRPTKKARKTRTSSVDVAIRNEEERLNWVRKKLMESGCNIMQVNEINKDVIYMKKPDKNECFERFYSYEMVVQVADKEKFRHAIRTGIGRSKAYGAGLCLVVGRG